MAPSLSPWRARIQGHRSISIDTGWEASPAPPHDGPDRPDLASLTWLSARVPGTAAGARRDAGVLDETDLDEADWWFRVRFPRPTTEPGDSVVLCLGGIATTADIHLNGSLVGSVESMFLSTAIDVGDRLEPENELVIHCRALTPQLAITRRPRARWRTRLVKDGALRWFRTTLLGRAPGFAPGPAAVGPWRPVWLEIHRGIEVERLDLRPTVDGQDGILSVDIRCRSLDGDVPVVAEVELRGPSGTHHVHLPFREDGAWSAGGRLRVPAVERWWPHTHGEPVLHDVRVQVRTRSGRAHAIDAGRVGFRSLRAGADGSHRVERDGLDLHVNGVPIFTRGAVWTPPDPIGLAAGADLQREMLSAMADAGMNMVRLVGTGTYETSEFHDLCDELGILVWQDLMFANLDYPFEDEHFAVLVKRELEQALGTLAGRPSLAVLCGNSEVEQQVAMLGLDPALGRVAFYDTTIPAMAAAVSVDAIVVPSAPFGGDPPFRPDTGIANYYGVGGYRRPLSDARLSGVRFAAECLAIANLSDGAVAVDVSDDTLRSGVPRDVGASWDFVDVRDHYLAALFGVEPDMLRAADPDRYLALSRAISGEVMAEVFGEWRRAASPCSGGLVLWLRDVVPGAGWGLIDREGRPKAAFRHLRRILAPIAIWTTDEGLNGIAVHVANDRPRPLEAEVRVTVYQDREAIVGNASADMTVEANGHWESSVETILGRFVDASGAYRFGSPGHHTIAVELRDASAREDEPVSQSFRFPDGPPIDRESVEQMGLTAEFRPQTDGGAAVVLATRRLAYGIRVELPGHVPSDDSFSIAPGRTRTIRLEPTTARVARAEGAVSALNLDRPIPLPGMRPS